jgi:hypothetical protein
MAQTRNPCAAVYVPCYSASSTRLTKGAAGAWGADEASGYGWRECGLASWDGTRSLSCRPQSIGVVFANACRNNGTVEATGKKPYLSGICWVVPHGSRHRPDGLAEACPRDVEGGCAKAGFLADAFGIVAVTESLIHGNHNHVRRETHGSHTYWVHRKGAQSAASDEPGVIPGSMATPSFHVSGRGCPTALCSCSHGAGRAMSRSAAVWKISLQRLHREMQGVWFDWRRADALRDEAPSAYKDIRAVMRAQHELTRIDRELRSLLNYKGT